MVYPVGRMLARASSTANLAVPNGLVRIKHPGAAFREGNRVMRAWRTGLAGRKDEMKVGLVH